MRGSMETRNKTFLQTLNISQRDSFKKRDIIKLSQIVITDFSFCEAAFEKKRKRCPFFLMNKTASKRKIHEGNLFTKEGIILSTISTCQESTCSSIDTNNFRSIVPKEKSLRKVLRKASLVTYNFEKAKTPKHIAQSHQTISDFPVFFLNKKQRCLESASPEGKPQKQHLKHRRTYSQARPMLKSDINNCEGNNFSGWKTLDLDDEQL